MSAAGWTAPSNLVSSGWHPAVRFVARHSGKALDATNGDHCEQRTVSSSPSQIFFLIDAGGGQFNIVNKGTGKYLDVAGGSKDDGAKILLWEANGAANQKWTLKPTADGYIVFTAGHSGKAIDVAGGSTAENAQTFQWTTHGGQNQQWKMERVDSDTVLIRCLYNNKVLEAESGENGAKLVQRDANGNANQKFILRATPDGYYRLTHATSGRALDCAGGASVNATPLILWDVHGNPNQQFKLFPTANGFLSLLPRHSEAQKKAVDVPKDNATAALLWDYHGEANQQFRFEFA